MILTYKIKHNRSCSDELAKAKQVAEYGIKYRTRSSKDVKHIGLNSSISNQILKKYANNKSAKKVTSVKLTIPNQKIELRRNKRKIGIIPFAATNKCGIRMENLKGIRDSAKCKKSFKYSLHSWSFYQLQFMLEYKARLLGVKIEYVNPEYTSQDCSRCGYLGIRKGESFKCPHSGHVDHADGRKHGVQYSYALR